MAKMINQSFEILSPTNWDDELRKIEMAARNCYQSEPKGDPGAFIQRLIKRGHTAMIEFGNMSVQFITDRGVTHEIVRHRLFSFAQESTRYCRYDDYITVIKPSTWNDWDGEAQQAWTDTMFGCERAYIGMLEKGLSPQQARAVLPNSLKTSIIVSGNFRQWRNFFALRDDKAAHPDMQALVAPLHTAVINLCPAVFA